METVGVKGTNFHVQETRLRIFEFHSKVYYLAGSSYQMKGML